MNGRRLGVKKAGQGRAERVRRDMIKGPEMDPGSHLMFTKVLRVPGSDVAVTSPNHFVFYNAQLMHVIP